MVIPLVDDGKLSIKSLQKYFPSATGLTYAHKNETIAVTYDNEGNLIIGKEIYDYNVYIPEGGGSQVDAKKRRLDQMLSDIGLVKKSLKVDVNQVFIYILM